VDDGTRRHAIMFLEWRPRATLATLAAVVALQSACSAPVRPDSVALSPIDKVAVAGARFSPKYDFQSLSKASAGARGAAEAVGSCGQVLGAAHAHDPLGSALAGVVYLVCLPVASVIGRSAAEAKAPSDKQFADARSAAQLAVTELKLQVAAADSAVRYGNNFGRNLTLLQGNGPANETDTPSYTQAKDVADKVIEISVLEVTAATTGMKNLPVSMFMNGRVRVVRTSDNVQLDTFTVRYFGGARPVDEWLADGGKGIRAELDRGASTLAEQAIDEVLLIYRHSAAAPTRSSASLAPSATQEPKRTDLVPPYALRPVEPPLRNKVYWGPRMNYGHLEIYPLPSLQSTFQWEAFPRGYDIAPGPGPGEASALRYDFRIFGDEGIVYERRDLEGTSHRLEQSLQPCRIYRWTVRGRFALGGVGYATEWTGAYDTMGGQVAPWWWRRGSGVPLLADVPETVVPFYPLFETPSVTGNKCPE